MSDEYIVAVTLQVTAQDAEAAMEIVYDAVCSLRGIVHHAFIAEQCEQRDLFAEQQQRAGGDE